MQYQLQHPPNQGISKTSSPNHSLARIANGVPKPQWKRSCAGAFSKRCDTVHTTLFISISMFVLKMVFSTVRPVLTCLTCLFRLNCLGKFQFTIHPSSMFVLNGFFSLFTCFNLFISFNLFRCTESFRYKCWSRWGSLLCLCLTTM